MQSNQLALCAFAICIVNLRAWSPPHHSHHQRARFYRESPRSTIFFAADNNEGPEELIQDNTVDKESTTAVYGVSYIGGDPCSSKYNNDPFDASEDSFKPGLPDDMKDRIAALAAKKSQERKEKEG